MPPLIPNLLAYAMTLASITRGSGGGAFPRSVGLTTPDQALGWLNMAHAENLLGHGDAARRGFDRSVTLLKAGRGQLSPIARLGAIDRTDTHLLRARGDFREADRVFNTVEARTDYGGSITRPPREGMHPGYHALLHEVTRGLAASRASDGDLRTFENQNDPLFPRAQAAAMLEDWSTARRLVEARLVSAQAEGPRLAVYALRRIEPELAVLEARTGDLAAARARVTALPEDCDPCRQARAQVAALAGERGEAERLFALLARRYPDVPGPLVVWAQTRLDRGDPAGALPLLRQAAGFGPRWAEPQKYQGDALLALGRHAEAVTGLCQLKCTAR